MTRHNLCPNPACGTNVTGYGGGSTPTRVTGLSGFPVTTGANYSTGTFITTPTGVVSPGQVVAASIYARVNGAVSDPGTVFLSFTRSAGGDDFSQSAGFTLTGNTVTRVTITGTAPALATGVYLTLDSLNLAGQNADVTAALYEVAAAVDTYFDGNSAGGSWDGTANNSTSTLADAGVAPDGLAVAVTFGGPTVAAGLSVAPDGLAVPVTFGQPFIQLVPDSLVIPVSFGQPSVLAAPAASSGGAWETYGSILEYNAEQRGYERTRVPVDCPNDGTPLQQAPNGKLHCPFDGWTWPDKRILWSDQS